MTYPGPDARKRRLKRSPSYRKRKRLFSLHSSAAASYCPFAAAADRTGQCASASVAYLPTESLCAKRDDMLGSHPWPT